MPSDTTYCPKTFGFEQVTEANKTMSHTFDVESPNKEAYKWHCKYGFTTTDKVKMVDADGAATLREDRGYVYLIAEGSGFDDDIVIIVQPRDKYLDFNF